jgi:hypothetical protein
MSKYFTAAVETALKLNMITVSDAIEMGISDEALQTIENDKINSYFTASILAERFEREPGVLDYDKIRTAIEGKKEIRRITDIIYNTYILEGVEGISFKECEIRAISYLETKNMLHRWSN